MSISLAQLRELIVRSRLFSVEQATELFGRFDTSACNPGSASECLNWFVARGHLTRHQAELLIEGRLDSLFLDEYRILDKVGKGRVAKVYRATHPTRGTVALKVLPPSKARDPHQLARFQREARLAMQLDHPNIVKSYECRQCRGLHYLVMDYLEGVTLDEVIKEREKLTPRETVRLGVLILLGLEHIHQQNMVHRDLKPGNIMLCPAPLSYENTTRSNIKILDVGLGRELFDPDSDVTADAELTMDNAILGTPDYMAPEQARDARKADIRSDLYSLGCLMYHALAGAPPFADDSLVRQILRHATQPAVPLEQAAGVPKPLSQVVAILLAKTPEDRYQTPTEAAKALRACLQACPR